MQGNHRFRRWGRACALALLIAGTGVASASDPPIRSYRLELKPMHGIEHGKAAVVKGEVGKTPHRFVVDGVTSLMPVVVLVRPVRGEDSVAIRLSKYGWNQPLRSGEAKGKPEGFKFRTEGEFQIAVSSGRERTPYRLLVWAGDEVKPELRPVVVKASELKDGKGGIPRLWWIVGGLVVVGAGVAVFLMRRKPS